MENTKNKPKDFAEFVNYCKSALFIGNDKAKIVKLYKILTQNKWQLKNGKPTSNWKALTNSYNSVLFGKNPNKTTKKSKSFNSEKAFPDNGMNYVCYTHGSCDNKSVQKIGGSAYVILKDNEIIKIKAHGAVGTTNNRMELLAISNAVNSCPEGAFVDIYTDSQYSILVLSKTKTPKLNADLHALYIKSRSHVADVRFHWVKSHNGDKYNEMADSLAYSAYVEKCNEFGIKPMKRH